MAAVAPAAKVPAPVTPSIVPYRNRYLDEVAPSGIAGRLIKFNKDGDYITIDDEKEVPENAEFILLADDTLVGWIKFNGVGEAPDRQMGLLFDGYEVPARESLGDLDPKDWDLGLDNQPQDPWQHQHNIVLQNTETNELFTFSTTIEDRPARRRKSAPALHAHAEDAAGRTAGDPSGQRWLSAQRHSRRVCFDAGVCRRRPRAA